jgi:glycosyltransferase involved in cell wall biosynthesis
LAAGRPVVAQDTGFSDVVPTGEGVLTFETVEEAATAIDRVCVDYERHRAAARGIAEEYLDSDLVLAALLEAVL